jgi:hypothetical protein
VAVIVVSIPAVAGMLACRPRALPGNRAMLGFVTFSILVTLGVTAAMAIERFAAGM